MLSMFAFWALMVRFDVWWFVDTRLVPGFIVFGQFGAMVVTNHVTKQTKQAMRIENTNYD